jgi:cobalt-zinc-cadmium efflux system membrane fusion protein
MNRTLFSFLIVGLVSGCSRQKEAPSEPESVPVAVETVTLTDQQRIASSIETGTIEMRQLSGGIPVTGMLDAPPQNLVNVTAPFGGFLRSTSLLQGMRVSKGQVIAIVENPEYIQLQQDYLDTRSQVTFLTKEHERQEKLAAENVNAQKTVQKSQADLESMKARNSGLRAKLKMLGIDPDPLRPDAIRSTIELRAPITGYVTKVNSVLGTFVSATDVMFTLVDTEHLHAELVCFERDIPRIRIGQKIRFTLAHETKERTATVYLIGREISDDRSVRVHGHLDKEDRNLIPGMYLKAVIQTGTLSLPSLPEEAVLRVDDREVIFVDEGKGVFRMKAITTGVHENGFVEIILPDGIDPASLRVVTRNAYKLLSQLQGGQSED